jgi:hypothetical protein
MAVVSVLKKFVLGHFAPIVKPVYISMPPPLTTEPHPDAWFKVDVRKLLIVV